MNVVISQPMLFPWVGMLEQVRLAHTYVHYSDVQFSKGSFVNRVQIKTAQGIKWMTVPVSFSLGQRIDGTRIDGKRDWRQSHLSMLTDAYATCPFVGDMLAMVRSVYDHDYPSIGRLSEASLMASCRYFGFDRDCSFLHSDQFGIDGASSRRVLDIALAVGGTRYITGHGARNYLDHGLFEAAGVRVEYMDYQRLPYPQQHGAFTPYVSVLDLIANCGPDGGRFICSGSIYWKEFIDGSE
jgi:hypothetical protein